MVDESPDFAMTNPPWLQADLLELLAGRDRLHHALLIHGAPGIGKLAFARQLSQALLCEQSDSNGLACGHCAACHWMAEGAHPDYRMVTPEALDPDFVPGKSRKPSTEIKAEQIRSLGRFLAVGGHRNGWRIVLIYPAHRMNYVTANGLLKTLEEPGTATLLILVTSQPDRLAATVRSRCRQLRLTGPAPAEALQWLSAAGLPDEAQARAALAAGGSPLRALNFADPAWATAHQAILEAVSSLPETGPLRAIDALDRQDPMQWASVLQRWISDLTRVIAGAQPGFFPDQQSRLAELAVRTTLTRATALQAQLLDLNARIEHPLNARLICETALLAYLELFESSGSAQ